MLYCVKDLNSVMTGEEILKKLKAEQFKKGA